MKKFSTEPLVSAKRRSRLKRSRFLIKVLMRISTVNIFLFSLAATCGATSVDVKGQGIEKTSVELEFHNVPLKTVFEEIEKQTDYMFILPMDKVNAYTNVSLDAGSYTVKDVLDNVLKGTGLSYEQVRGYVLVFGEGGGNPYKQIKESDGNEFLTEYGIDRPVVVDTVFGIIKDVNGYAIAGVNVVEKGTTNGTSSDSQGKYVIKVGIGAVLVFSFIGYRTFESEVNGRIVLNVVLEEDVKELQEVTVNAGYWAVKQTLKTGNISRVEGKMIETQQVSNPLQALQGRMPGVYVSQRSGIPGGAFDIRIRGQNSLRDTQSDDGNKPLYIIDGVPFTATTLSLTQPSLIGQGNPLSAINPYDIASIEVLKDADATAIYGSRGANGVILITTKKGSVGAAKFDLNVSQGIGQVANRVRMLNTEQYIEIRKEAFVNDNNIPGATDYDVNGSWDQTRYTDWQELLIGGTAKTINANSTISAGNEKIKFMITGGYYKESTVFPGNMYYQKGSTKFYLDHTSENKKLNINLTSTFVAENNNLASTQFHTLIYDLPPNAPELYNDDKSLNWENGLWANPLASLEKEYKSNTHNLITNFVVGYKPVSGLQIKTSIGYNALQTKELLLNPISSQNPFSSTKPTASANFGRAEGNTWIMEPQIEYQRLMGQSTIKFLTGCTFQGNGNESLFTRITGVENDVLLQSIASAPQGGVVSSNSYIKYKYAAVFGRLNYSFENKYLINLTGRRDGSSRFGPGNQFANFGAFGLAWVFSKEDFFKNGFRFLSFGKVRSSYGTSGSDQINNYGFFDTYQPTTTQYLGLTSIAPTGLANRDYAWEVNRKFEIAIELGFIDEKIFLAASYYKNRSSNQLVGLPLPATTGFTSIPFNLPAVVQNNGIELELNTINIESKYVRWTTGFNVSIPRNKLVEYPNIESSSYALTYAVGEPLSVVVGYKLRGVDPQTGLYQFSDEDENGTTSIIDRKSIVDNGVNFFGGVHNVLQYKNLTLDVFLQFVDKQTANYRNAFVSPGNMGNQPVEILNRWRNVGDISDIQKVSSSASLNTLLSNWRLSEAGFVNGAFARLKNVTISWATHESSRRLGVKIYLQGQNLLTITEFKGIDPETGTTGMPLLRIVSLGAQLTL